MEVFGIVERSVWAKDKPTFDHNVKVLMDQYLLSKPVVKALVEKSCSLYRRTPADFSMTKPLTLYARPLKRGQCLMGARMLREYLYGVVGRTYAIELEQTVEFLIEKESSPGWPFNKLYHTRRELLAKDGLQLSRDWWESGKRAIWSGCLKDELVKCEKLQRGLVRFFACCPLPVQLQIMRFSTILNWKIVFASSEFRFCTYVGVAPQDGGWNRIFSEFSRRDFFFSLDETAYDTTLHEDLFKAIYRIRNNLHVNPWPQADVDRLINEVVRTVIVTDTGEVVQKHQGNSSGSPNTIHDNSLILIMLYFETYLRLYPTDNLSDFFKYISLLVIGDDNFCGVSIDRGLFTSREVMKTMEDWGIEPRIESESKTVEGMEFVSKIITKVQVEGMSFYVPVPKQPRFIAHLLMSTPGEDLLASGLKINSLLAECAFDDTLWDMVVYVQDQYRKRLPEMKMWEFEDMPIAGFTSGLVSRQYWRERYVVGRFENLRLQCKRIRRKSLVLEMPKNAKKKNMAAGKRAKKSLQPKSRKIVARPRNAASSSALGSLVGRATNFAEKIPMIGNVVEKVDSVASSILSFLGMGSSLFSVHYDLSGRQLLVPHSHVSVTEDEKLVSLSAGENVEPGTILLRYLLTIGPQGSRSRAMGQLYEKVMFHGFQLSVNANCAASTSGSLAYVYVPDPADATLDEMQPSERLSALCSRENVQFAQVWQSTILHFRLPAKEFYVKMADGVERMTSPGAVYVVAMTALNPEILPTLRQTSSLTFTKPTNALPTDTYAVGMVSVEGRDAAEGQHRFIEHIGTVKGDFTKRVSVKHYSTYYPTTETSFFQHGTVLAFKGEMVRIGMPMYGVAGAGWNSTLVTEPVWMPAAIEDKPADTRLWTGLPLLPGNPRQMLIEDGHTADLTWYELYCETDVEIAFITGVPIAGTQVTMGAVVLVVDRSAVQTEYTSSDLSRIMKSAGKVTLAKPVKRKKPRAIVTDEPEIVVRNEPKVVATPLSGQSSRR
jgi:hypothetical protein